MMTTKIPKNITPAKFAKWLKSNTDCDAKVKRGDCVEAIVYADHIEPGKCVPLVAELDDDILMITEFTNDYYYPQAAQRAIDIGRTPTLLYSFTNGSRISI